MFALEQGIESPRDGSVNWQTYEFYEKVAEAKKEAKRHPNGLWRIVEQKVIWNNQIDK